jgi:hypothetical protein
LDAGAVSRLLQKDEVAYILNEEDLRDDMNPLTDKEKAMLIAKWGDKQSLQIQEIIARHQMEQRESISTDILKGSESTLEGFLDDTDRSQDSLDTEAINKDTIMEYNNQLYDNTTIYSLHVHGIKSKISTISLHKEGILPEYTFCFYCDGDGIISNHYIEKESITPIIKQQFPYLLTIDGQCLICLSIHTWINGVPTYTSVVAIRGLHFKTPLNREDLNEYMHESDKWVQKTII